MFDHGARPDAESSQEIFQPWNEATEKVGVSEPSSFHVEHFVEQAAWIKVTNFTVAKAQVSFSGSVLVLAGFATVSASVRLSSDNSMVLRGKRITRSPSKASPAFREPIS